MMMLPQLPSWAVMWLLALGLYGTGKGASLATAHLRGVPVGRKMAYLLMFPGMNAAGFCAAPPGIPQRRAPATGYAMNVLVGALLLWGVARRAPHPYLQGWIGMVGIILLLHFGLLQLLSLAWQAAGRDAPLLMNEPIRAASLTEFWGRRWNTAFRQLSHQFLFKPLARHTGPRAALLLTFAVSGWLHDLVISVPAGAGYGLPTAYFMLQGLGLLLERSRFGRSLLHRPSAARCFTMAIVALPAPLLCHPPFVLRVVVPFMAALGALPKGVNP